MKEIEIFHEMRKLRQRFTLRVRLIIIVTFEILISFGLAVLIDWLCVSLFKDFWNVPILVEMFIIAILVGIFATSALTRWHFNPLKKIGNALDKISEGDFSVRLETKSTSKEIRELYSGFNMMAQELQSTETVQTDFVSNVSHELKTPISAIEGYSMLLQDSDGLSDEQKEYIDKIIFNTKRLSSLTGSILLLSKLENQSIITNKVKFDLDEQVRQSILAFESEWERKEIEFEIELDDTDYVGNEALLHHIWDNIINNAIKFTPVGSEIKISLQNLENSIIFKVSDEGPGISETDKEHIFDKIYQADSSHRQEGHGLGLALAKKIVSLEGGEISVENNADKGCTFTVILNK